MKEINGLKFDVTLRVLYKVKEAQGHKTLNETYKYLGEINENLDLVIDVMLISYNIANKTSLTEDEFHEILSEKHIGFLKLGVIYGELLDTLLMDGLTDEERKNIMTQAEKLNMK